MNFSERLYESVPEAQRESFEKWLAEDPIALNEQFHRRFTAFWNAVIKDPNGPLGEVYAYYWRIEFQQRGFVTSPSLCCIFTNG